MNLNLNTIYALVIFPVIVAVAFFLFDARKSQQERSSVRIGERSWVTEVADTQEARRKGLSGRESLCSGCAMLFRFEQPGEYAFWMKGMRFPLDIVWIREGIILHIERAVPEGFSGTLSPAVFSTDVLEVNAHDMDGVSVGDRISIP